MGASADDRLTDLHTASVVGKPVDWINARAIGEDAEELARTERMPYRTAIEIVSGKTARPFGAPRPKA